MKPSRKQYTPAFKREAVALVIEQGHGYSEAANLLNIHASILRRWEQEQRLNGPQAFPGKGHQLPELDEIARLKRELKRAQMEIEILKKATAYDGRNAGARATQDDSMDGIGRVASGTKTERLPPSRRARYEGRLHSTTSGALSGGAAVRGAAGYAGWLLRLVQTPSIQT